MGCLPVSHRVHHPSFFFAFRKKHGYNFSWSSEDQAVAPIAVSCLLLWYVNILLNSIMHDGYWSLCYFPLLSTDTGKTWTTLLKREETFRNSSYDTSQAKKTPNKQTEKDIVKCQEVVLKGIILPRSCAIFSLDHVSRAQQILKDTCGLLAPWDMCKHAAQSEWRGREGTCLPIGRRCLRKGRYRKCLQRITDD